MNFQINNPAGDGVKIMVTTITAVDLFVMEVIVKQGNAVLVNPGTVRPLCNALRFSALRFSALRFTDLVHSDLVHFDLVRFDLKCLI